MRSFVFPQNKKELNILVEEILDTVSRWRKIKEADDIECKYIMSCMRNEIAFGLSRKRKYRNRFP